MAPERNPEPGAAGVIVILLIGAAISVAAGWMLALMVLA